MEQGFPQRKKILVCYVRKSLSYILSLLKTRNVILRLVMARIVWTVWTINDIGNIKTAKFFLV